jgi:hypothetical protein
MSNQSEEPATLVGHIQHLQVEDDPDGPVIVSKIKAENSEVPGKFFLRLTNNQPILEAQLNMLRDAIIHGIRVRIMFDPNNKLASNVSRIVAVRLQSHS